MDWSELTTADMAQLAVYGGFGLLLATAIPGLFRGRLLAGVLSLLLWAGVLFALLAAYAFRTELGAVAERVMAVLAPGTVVETGPNEVAVFRRPDGGFAVDGRVGRTRLSFAFDTGASTVVLRAEDAVRLKIPVKTLRYDVEVMTANGASLAAGVTLPSLSVGSITETDVEALVERPGALRENLLGMSFIGRLRSFGVEGDRLVLRGR